MDASIGGFQSRMILNPDWNPRVNVAGGQSESGEVIVYTGAQQPKYVHVMELVAGTTFPPLTRSLQSNFTPYQVMYLKFLWCNGKTCFLLQSTST